LQVEPPQQDKVVEVEHTGSDSDSGMEGEFFDALEEIERVNYKESDNGRSQSIIMMSGHDPKQRSELPWQKDPNMKISIWSIIKDSIG